MQLEAMTNPHASYVEQFNLLGYDATFAAVASELGVPVDQIYADYPSREALGAFWLEAELPDIDQSDAELHGMFTTLVCHLLRTLDGHRDFGRAWLQSLASAGVLNLPQMKALHEALHHYYMTWLAANRDQLSLPNPVEPEDVMNEIAQAMCTATAALLLHWHTDRTPLYCDTRSLTQAVAYWLHGLLIRQGTFGGTGLLLQLHVLAKVPHGRFLRPLLDLLIKPDLAGRLLDPAALFESMRNLLPPRVDDE